jgi:hypothetical protein
MHRNGIPLKPITPVSSNKRADAYSLLSSPSLAAAAPDVVIAPLDDGLAPYVVDILAICLLV